MTTNYTIQLWRKGGWTRCYAYSPTTLDAAKQILITRRKRKNGGWWNGRICEGKKVVATSYEV